MPAYQGRAYGHLVPDGQRPHDHRRGRAGPGGRINCTRNEPGWVCAQLEAEQTCPVRLAAGEPTLGGRATYCRNQLNVQAMTAAMYVAKPAAR